MEERTRKCNNDGNTIIMMIIVEAAELWPFETRWKETIFVSSVELARIRYISDDSESME